MRIPYLRRDSNGNINDVRQKSHGLVGDHNFVKRFQYAQEHLIEWAKVNVYGEITSEQLLQMYQTNLSTMKTFYSLENNEPIAYSNESIKQLESQIKSFCTEKTRAGFFAQDIFDSIQPSLENIYTQRQSRIRSQLNNLIQVQQEQIISLLEKKGFDTTSLEDCSDLTKVEKIKPAPQINFSQDAPNMTETLKDARFVYEKLKDFYFRDSLWVKSIALRSAQKQAEELRDSLHSEALKQAELHISKLGELQERYAKVKDLSEEEVDAIREKYAKVEEERRIAEAKEDNYSDLNITYYNRYYSEFNEASEEVRRLEIKSNGLHQIITDFQNKDILRQQLIETTQETPTGDIPLSSEEIAAWEKYHEELEKFEKEKAEVQDIPIFLKEIEEDILPNLTTARKQIEEISSAQKYPYFVYDQVCACNSFLTMPVFTNETGDIDNPLQDITLNQEELEKITKTGLPLGFVFNGILSDCFEPKPTVIADSVQTALESSFILTYQFNVSAPTYETHELIERQEQNLTDILKRLKNRHIHIDNYTPIENPLYPTQKAEDTRPAWERVGLTEEDFNNMTPLERVSLFPDTIPEDILEDIYREEPKTKKGKNTPPLPSAPLGQGDLN